MVINLFVAVLMCVFGELTGLHGGNFVEVQRHFQFENILRADQDHFWAWRSEASDLKTLRLVDATGGNSLEILVCIEPIAGEGNVILSLDDIRYANDGPSDVIYVTLNGIPWANYTTFEKWAHGHDWNIFRNTGRLGNSLVLPQGQYVVTVRVTTDMYGLELDKIRLNAEYQSLHSPLFCGGALVPN